LETSIYGDILVVKSIDLQAGLKVRGCARDSGPVVVIDA